MKKLGLIGGTGPESTLVYYRELNRRILERTEDKAFPEIIIDSLDLLKALDMISGKRYEELTEYVAASLKRLEQGGAELTALTAATMHLVYEPVKEQAETPFISIPETAAEYALSAGHKKVGLLGTIFTMEQDYLSRSFEQRGIRVIVPEKKDRIRVNEVIYGELEKGLVKPESVELLLSVIRKLQEEQGIDGVILGCTELPLALNAENCPVPPLDIMELHIRKLVELILE